MLEIAKKRKIRLIVYASFLSLFLSLAFLASLMIGAYPLSPMEVVNALFSPNEGPAGVIVNNYRLPRALSAVITGASLGIAGGVIQSLTRNPLADPYITGMSSGAAFGAAIAFILPSVSIFMVPLFAFIGGLTSIFLTMSLAKASKAGPIGFILAGIAVGTIFSSMLMLILTLAAEKAHGILYWIYGSFSTAGWKEIYAIFPIVVPSCVFLLVNARDLNILLLGEEHARQLGVNAKRLWSLMLFFSSLSVSTCVAFSGIIGFIGLVSPHLVRLMVSSDNRFVLPLSGLTGALLLILSDDIVKSPINPLGELPVGVITSIMGAPFFIYLLLKRGERYGI